MKASFFEALDFNRMLVTSVFFHLSFFILVMSLPKPEFLQEVVVPAFMVRLIDLPPSSKSPAKKGGVIPQKSQQRVRKLEQLNGKMSRTDVTVSNPLLHELDQLAELGTQVPKKKVAQKKNKTQDKVLKELQDLKKKKVALLPLPTTLKLKKPSLVDETLDELKRQIAALKKNKISPRKLKMPKAVIAEENLEELETKNPSELKLDSIKDQTSEMKFAELSPIELMKEETGGRSVEELLAELEAMPDSTKPVPATDKKAIKPILNKMVSLVEIEKSLKIEISKPSQRTFESAIGNQKTLRKKSKQVSQGKPGQIAGNGAGTLVPKGDKESADAFSLYIGLIHKRIYEHWKVPLGTQHDDIVGVSFYLYPKGNIDKPVLVKASQEEKLNTLAVQAIYGAEPFPEFPPEVKESNLHIKVNFKYKPGNE